MQKITVVYCFALLVALSTVAGGAPAEVFPLASASTLDINLATEAQLAQQLPGIGPAKAALIVQFRKAHGAFTAVEQLQQVKGIGPKTVEKLRKHVRIGQGVIKGAIGGEGGVPSQSRLEKRQSQDNTQLAFRRVINAANLATKSANSDVRASSAWYRRSLMDILRTH